MYANPDAPPKWVRWLWEVDASKAAEKQEEGKGLGVGKIVRAGVALADDEGLEGVSVRKLAQRLGVSTMAAYRHIGSRDEVVAGLRDAQVGLVLVGQAHGLLAVGGLGDDLVSGLGEGLDDVQADQGLILCDKNPAGSGGA